MYRSVIPALLFVVVTAVPAWSQVILSQDILYVPYLEATPTIDGDLSEWKDRAFSDGVWDIYRIRHQPWYDEGRRNRLTYQNDEPHPEDDLRARYYIAWDEENVYLGAEVVDNVNDVSDPAHAPRRWMYKDAICWFIEAPRDEAPEWFGRGDNAFCFVIDAAKPPHGAWWRHGTADVRQLEEPIPPAAVDYALEFNPWGTGEADFILEARVEMAPTFGVSDPSWSPPQVGDEYGMEIVHTDPDGGAYGGHFMIYGTGDNDATWARMILVGPQEPIERLPE